MADVQLPTGFRATHDTLGGPWVPWLPGPDAEDIMAAPGTGIDAPAAGRITRLSGRDPSQPPPQGVGGPWGLSLYFVTAGGDAFYGTHLSSVAPVGSYAKGQRIGTVGDYPGLAADHVHWGYVGNVSDPRVAGLVGGGTGQVPAMTNEMSKASQQAVHEIMQRSLEKGSQDIAAVLSVASVEGGFDPSRPPGDHGTSFGPFQLHKGGALPAGVADPQRWAWSKEGIDYAVDRAVAAEHGATGHAAITNIVRGFENPTNATAEIARASAIYDTGALGKSGESVFHKTEDLAKKPFDWAAKIGDILGLVFSIRGLQVAGGAVLIIVGILWLARASAGKALIPANVKPGGAGVAP